MKIYNLIFAGLLMSGCTDAGWQKVVALGDPGTIICYSGGKEIFNGTSTGKISTETESDGWFFKDAETGKLIRISGDCVIRN